MRRTHSAALLLPLMLALAGTVGCTQELKLLGEACTSADDCNSGTCGANGVCTRTCGGQGDCPTGFDCLTRDGDGEATCNKVAYPLLEKGGFRTNCTAETCNGASSPCNADEGFFCYSTDDSKCSPRNECTRKCEADSDCPPEYFCGEDTIENWKGGPKPEPTKACLKRARCSECQLDDQCPTGFRCVEDNIGGRFCGQVCNTIDDCLKPGSGTGGYRDFETCENNICTPVTGACHGKSSKEEVTEENDMCSPCRYGEPGDCKEGFHCVQAFTGERYCSADCTAPLKKNAEGRWEQNGNGDCGYGMLCMVEFLTEECTKASATACTGVGSCTTDTGGRGFTCFAR